MALIGRTHVDALDRTLLSDWSPAAAWEPAGRDG
jgi:hypothetical protein